MLAIALLGYADGAAAPPPQGREPPSDERKARMQSAFGGRVEVDGVPLADVEVALVGDDGDVLAASTTDARGAFTLSAKQRVAGGWILAKLRGPIIGVVAAHAPSAGGSIVLAVASKEAATLDVVARSPAGASVEWLDVELTPKSISGAPASVAGAITVAGTGPSRIGSYYTTRVREPRARLRVLRGAYNLRLEHIVERATTPTPPPPNWIGGTLTLPDGTRVPAQLGSQRIDVPKDLAVTVDLEVFDG